MSQFVYILSPPSLDGRFQDWGFTSITKHIALLASLRNQELSHTELKRFQKSYAITYRGLLLSDLDNEHHCLQDDRVKWDTNFPEFFEFSVYKSKGVLCFFGSFERENYVFTDKDSAVSEIQSQLYSFPVEMNLML